MWRSVRQQKSQRPTQTHITSIIRQSNECQRQYDCLFLFLTYSHNTFHPGGCRVAIHVHVWNEPCKLKDIKPSRQKMSSGCQGDRYTIPFMQAVANGHQRKPYSSPMGAAGRREPLTHSLLHSETVSIYKIALVFSLMHADSKSIVLIKSGISRNRGDVVKL